MEGNILIGILGASIILIAFILNETHVWNEDDLAYDTANFIGAAILVWYAWILASWPFAILNGVWCVVSMRDIVIDLRRRRG
jgi:hypothetical protein